MASSIPFEKSYEEHVEVHQKHWKEILDKYPGVTAVDVDYRQKDGKKVVPEELCIQVWVREKKSDLSKKQRLPTTIDGCRVDVIEGQATAIVNGGTAGANNRRRRRPRPYNRRLRGGDSIGVRDNGYDSGTLGYFVKCGDKIGALTNYHVVEQIGNEILSPSEADGGTYEENVIGKVTAHICTKNVDCAFVDLDDAYKPQRYMLRDEKGTVVTKKSRASVHDKYRYIGSVSEGEGTIKSVTWSGNVTGYGNDATSEAEFEEQIRLSKPAKPGDSGSLLRNEKDEATGLIFATCNEYGFANPIDKVLEALEADIAENKHTMKLRSHSKKIKK